MPSRIGLGRRLSRTLQLVRYHRPGQFAGRISRLLKQRLRRLFPSSWAFSPPSTDLRLDPEARPTIKRIADWRCRAWRDRYGGIDQFVQGKFTFLNQQLDLGASLSDTHHGFLWRSVEASRLWLFHLQCHEYLLALADKSPVSAENLLLSWLAEPAHQSPDLDPNAWHPFCISRRLPVWLCFAATHTLPENLEADFWRSMTNQIHWLRCNLETELGGNHLLENLCALYLADRFLIGGDCDSCATTNAMIRRELRDQILPSGEHFERSPTYHAIMLLSVLQMREASESPGDPLRGELVHVSQRMSAWLDFLRYEDGTIPLLGDSALDETPDPSVLIAWTKEQKGSSAEECSPDDEQVDQDYWKFSNPAGDSICFDTGHVGCDHLPAHAHADLLQVVASVSGKPFVVDTGNFDYEASSMRAHCRSTEAHNVLQVDGAQQCDLWSIFRMGRRGHITSTRRGEHGNFKWCSGTHDAYRHIGVGETGRVVIAGMSTWTVIDWIQSRRQHEMVSRVHLHPDCRVALGENPSESPSLCRVQFSEGNRTLEFLALGENKPEWTVGDGWYCPKFGHRMPNKVLELTGVANGDAWIGWQIRLIEETEREEQIESIASSLGKLTIQFALEGQLTIGFDRV